MNTSISTPKDTEKWVENFARFGVAAKGGVYLLVGILTTMAAFGEGGKVTGKGGAFREILDKPFGQVLLGLIAVGLLGYVMWRFIQAIKDPDNKGSDGKGMLMRVAYFISGVLYLALAIYAITLITGGSGGSGGGGRESLVAKVLQKSYGQWLVGAAALAILAKGGYQIYRAYSDEFMKRIKSLQLGAKVQRSVKMMGKIGFLARGIVLGIVGYFLLRAAIESNSNNAGGTEQAFQFLQNTGGTILLAAVAIGLAAYGAFMFVRAKYGQLAIS
ncbi:MAG: DUF1206 domain-containing protein [Catalinimonas sp.]